MRHPVPKSLLLALLLGAAGFAARALPEREDPSPAGPGRARGRPVQEGEGPRVAPRARLHRPRAALARRNRAGLRRPHLRPRVRPEPGRRRPRGTGHDPALLAPPRPLRGSAGPRRRDDGPIRRTGRDARHVVLRRRRRPPDSARPDARRRGADDARRPLGRHAALGRRPLLLDGPASGPAVSSLAEPFDARTFWPCVDDPADKAVTTVAVTVPDGYVAASAGLGASAPAAAPGKVTWTWRLPQPISTYLVSIAVGPLRDDHGRVPLARRDADDARRRLRPPGARGHQPDAGGVDGPAPRGPRVPLRRVPLPRHEVRDRRRELLGRDGAPDDHPHRRLAPRERLARPDEPPRPRAGPHVVGRRGDDADAGTTSG